MNEDQIFQRLRPHQVEPVRHLRRLLDRGINAVDWSATGTGKTYVAAATSALLRRPTLCVVPKIAQTSWNTAAEHFHDSVSVIGYEALRTGRSVFGTWENTPPPGFTHEQQLKCVNCQLYFDPSNPQPCYTHHAGIHCVKTTKKKWKYGKFTFHKAIGQLIFDESHRCNGIDSLNYRMMEAANRQRIPTLCLSATAASSPLHMNALGQLLDLHCGKNSTPYGVPFNSWLRRFGIQWNTGFGGWLWKKSKAEQKQIMVSIRDQIIPKRGVRVTTDQIKGFPPCTISAELYDIEGSSQIDAIYKNMADDLDALEKQKELDQSPDHPLTVILRGRQKIELLKVPLMIELAKDHMEKGSSVALFVNFRQTLDALAKRLKTDCIIDGSSRGIKNRQHNIDLFQSNESHLILVNNAAGGVSISLHDLYGGHPRVGLVMPDFSATNMRQVFGRLPRDKGKTPVFYYVLFAAGTIEQPVQKGLVPKLDNIDALNDADFQPDNLRLQERKFKLAI